MTKFVPLKSALAASSLLALSPAHSAEPLQPIEPWVVDFADSHCTASRTYGTKEKPVTIAFRPSASGDVMRLMIGRTGRVWDARHFPVTVSHSAVATKASALRFGSADRKLNVVWVNLERKDLEGLGAAGRIGIRGEGVDEQFILPQIAKVLSSLETCRRDLRKHWNIEDGAEDSALPTPAIPLKPLHTLFSDEDYPGQAVAEGKEGISGFTLFVDEKGVLKDCSVDQTSGIATLDAMGCGLLLQRAKFTPASDAAGKPVRSVTCTRISWRMAD